MCRECDLLVDEAERIVLLAEAERILILAESDRGVNIPDARRPLFAHEVRAGVRFGDMNDALAQGERLNAAHVSKAADALVDELLRYVPDGTTAADAAGIIAQLVVKPPETVQNILDQLTGQVAEVLASLRVYGHDSVVEEANRQGVEFTGFAGDSYLKRALSKATGAAAGVAASLWTTITGRANAAVTNTYDVARPAVRKDVLDPGLKGTLDLARQATHDQQNEGRRDGAAEAPEPPARIYAGELLDGSTCPRCEDIDGYEFADEEEAERWYPAGGPMRYCLGGNRCRGTLIYDWSDLGEPFDGGVDKERPPRLPLTPDADSLPTGLPPVPPPDGFKSRGLPDDADEATRTQFKDFAAMEKHLTRENMAVFWGGASVGRTARGGHRPDSEAKGKTLLPKDRNWTREGFEDAIRLTLADPDVIEKPSKNATSLVAWRVINGVQFKVEVLAKEVTGGREGKRKGSVLHAYPVSGIGVVRVDKDGKRHSVPLYDPPKRKNNVLYYHTRKGDGS